MKKLLLLILPLSILIAIITYAHVNEFSWLNVLTDLKNIQFVYPDTDKILNSWSKITSIKDLTAGSSNNILNVVKNIFNFLKYGWQLIFYSLQFIFDWISNAIMNICKIIKVLFSNIMVDR